MHATEKRRMNFSSQTIWTGDNLSIMRGMNSETADLIYLDPPFNSKANYAAPIGSAAAGDTRYEWRARGAGRSGARRVPGSTAHSHRKRHPGVILALEPVEEGSQLQSGTVPAAGAEHAAGSPRPTRACRVAHGDGSGR